MARRVNERFRAARTHNDTKRLSMAEFLLERRGHKGVTHRSHRIAKNREVSLAIGENDHRDPNARIAVSAKSDVATPDVGGRDERRLQRRIPRRLFA